VALVYLSSILEPYKLQWFRQAGDDLVTLTFELETTKRHQITTTFYFTVTNLVVIEGHTQCNSAS